MFSRYSAFNKKSAHQQPPSYIPRSFIRNVATATALGAYTPGLSISPLPESGPLTVDGEEFTSDMTQPLQPIPDLRGTAEMKKNIAKDPALEVVPQISAMQQKNVGETDPCGWCCEYKDSSCRRNTATSSGCPGYNCGGCFWVSCGR